MGALRNSMSCALLALMIGGCLAAAQDTRTREAFDAGSLLIPNEMKLVIDPTRYPDFYIYDVKSGGKDIVRIYVGNAADAGNRQYETIRIGSCLARSSRRAAAQQQDRIDRDVIIDFEDTAFPMMVHFFYRDLTGDVAKQADMVIESFRPTDGRTCATRN